jgi:hypothetical protein
VWGIAGGAAASAPTPTLARTLVVSRLSGTVLVKEKGAGSFKPLVVPREIAVGSAVDATRGMVQLVAAGASNGKVQTGRFDGGAFVVGQSASALTELRLTGGNAGACARRARARSVHSASVSSAVLRLLRGSAKGNFRTIGRYSAATVRGTEWLTEDLCQSTLTAVQRGTVTVLTGRDVRTVDAGGSEDAFCSRRFMPGVAGYCLLLFGAAIHGRAGLTAYLEYDDNRSSAASTYMLCLAEPGLPAHCTQHQLNPAPQVDCTSSGDCRTTGPSTFKTSSAACVTGRAGVYTAEFQVAGRVLSPQLSTEPLPAVRGQRLSCSFSSPSILTLACPAGGQAGSPLPFTGTLTPAVAGSPVSIDYTSPGAMTPITHSVRTDANGAFGDSFVAPAPGSYSVSASFDGGSGADERQSSTSDTCTINVS